MQNEPVRKGGNIFNVSEIQKIDILPEIKYVRAWDLASSKQERIKDDPDFTVGILMGIVKTFDNISKMYKIQIYIKDMIRFREEAPKRNQIILDTSISTKKLLENPNKVIDIIKSLNEKKKIDLMVAPSGFGLPLKNINDLTEREIFLTILKFKEEEQEKL